ncbi:MAG: hypothetical protein JWM32_2974 [Verrucomicrobia bacterium]|nr:hypothetical protein [Verrucomicrobiota bacterium]
MNILLEPSVLAWARRRARLDAEELAIKLGIPEEDITKWETDGEIDVDILEKLADATHTPVGFLYLNEPHKETLPISDFRTVGGAGIDAPTPDLLETVYDAQRKQAWYKDHLIQSGANPLWFVGSVSLRDDPATVAKKVNAAMGISTVKRAVAINKETALVAMIERIEECGILVLRNNAVGIEYDRRLSVGEFRGFALSDPYAPLIFVNSADARAAQLFTLAHEIVHIWLGVSGISNLAKTYSGEVDVEKFCNAVAAEILVPTNELLAKVSGIPLTDYRIARLGTYFRVSVLVMLRRLKDIGAIEEKQFQAMYDARENHFKELAARAKLAAKKRDGGGPSFYNAVLLPRVSPTFAHALVGSALEGRTLYRDAMGLLGLKTTSAIHAMGKRFGFVS